MKSPKSKSLTMYGIIESKLLYSVVNLPDVTNKPTSASLFIELIMQVKVSLT